MITDQIRRNIYTLNLSILNIREYYVGTENTIAVALPMLVSGLESRCLGANLGEICVGSTLLHC